MDFVTSEIVSSADVFGRIGLDVDVLTEIRCSFFGGASTFGTSAFPVSDCSRISAAAAPDASIFSGAVSGMLWRLICPSGNIRCCTASCAGADCTDTILGFALCCGCICAAVTVDCFTACCCDTGADVDAACGVAAAGAGADAACGVTAAGAGVDAVCGVAAAGAVCGVATAGAGADATCGVAAAGATCGVAAAGAGADATCGVAAAGAACGVEAACGCLLRCTCDCFATDVSVEAGLFCACTIADFGTTRAFALDCTCPDVGAIRAVIVIRGAVCGFMLFRGCTIAATSACGVTCFFGAAVTGAFALCCACICDAVTDGVGAV